MKEITEQQIRDRANEIGDAPAIPFYPQRPWDNESSIGYPGLTKREYFAGLAMQGLLSNPAQIDTTNFEWIARHAKGYADALLAELEAEHNLEQ
jgi:hypothetical protein